MTGTAIFDRALFKDAVDPRPEMLRAFKAWAEILVMISTRLVSSLLFSDLIIVDGLPLLPASQGLIIRAGKQHSLPSRVTGPARVGDP